MSVTAPVKKRIRREVNLALEPEAKAILDHYAPPGAYNRGKLLSRLLFEHQAREEAKEEARRRLRDFLKEDGGAL